MKVEVRRPSAGDDSFHCTFMACIGVGLCTCIEGIFLKKLTWVEAIHILRQNLTVYSSFMNIELHNFNIEFRNQQLLFPEYKKKCVKDGPMHGFITNIPCMP